MKQQQQQQRKTRKPSAPPFHLKWPIKKIIIFIFRWFKILNNIEVVTKSFVVYEFCFWTIVCCFFSIFSVCEIAAICLSKRTHETVMRHARVAIYRKPHRIRTIHLPKLWGIAIEKRFSQWDCLRWFQVYVDVDFDVASRGSLSLSTTEVCM